MYIIQEHSLERISIQRTQILDSKNLVQKEDHRSPKNIKECAIKKSL
jgi:hypothetical protein